MSSVLTGCKERCGWWIRQRCSAWWCSTAMCMKTAIDWLKHSSSTHRGRSQLPRASQCVAWEQLQVRQRRSSERAGGSYRSQVSGDGRALIHKAVGGHDRVHHGVLCQATVVGKKKQGKRGAHMLMEFGDGGVQVALQWVRLHKVCSGGDDLSTIYTRIHTNTGDTQHIEAGALCAMLRHKHHYTSRQHPTHPRQWATQQRRAVCRRACGQRCAGLRHRGGFQWPLPDEGLHGWGRVCSQQAQSTNGLQRL